MQRVILFLIAVGFGACSAFQNNDGGSGLNQKVINNNIDSLINASENYYTAPAFNDSLFDKYLQEAVQLAQQYNFEKCEAEIYNIVGKRYRNVSRFGESLFFYQKGLEIANQIENDSLKAYMNHQLAVVFRRVDDNAKALSLHFKALEWAESVQDTFLILSSNNGIGNVYFSYNDLPKAIRHFHHSLHLLTHGYQNWLSEAINTNNIGEAWLKLGYPDSALYYLNRSYQINVEHGSLIGQAICKNGLGDVYVHLKKYNKAITFYDQALELNHKVGNRIYKAGNYENLGNAYMLMGNYKKAEAHLKKGLMISQEIGSKSNIVNCLTTLSELYKKTGKSSLAIEYLEQTIQYKDSITEEVSRLNSEGMNALYRSEKQERELVILRQQNELSQLKLNRQRTLILSSIIIILGGIVFLVFVLYQRRVASKYNEQIEKQHKSIKDSIRYAEKIQSAIMPDFSQLKQVVDDYFVLFRPRDIISGDFYWLTRKNNLTIIVAADCTGHGVPGAFMSMLGIAFLNEIVNKENITEPHLILNRLREEVIRQLKQKGDLGESKDGMELALYVIDHDNQTLRFSGAYNPLLIIRAGELIQLKADRMPIGYHPKKDYSFSMQQFQLQKGDCIYTFSDGYHDQFGGKEGRKFLVQTFKEVLLNIYFHPMQRQKEILNSTIDAWRGDIEQIDDMIVIGVRI